MHVLVIPTRHIPAVRDATGAEGEALLGRLLAFSGRGGARAGARRRAATASSPTPARDAGQSVDHLHLHLLGGRKLTWPPG